MTTDRLPFQCIDYYERKLVVEFAAFRLLNIESEWTKSMRDLGFFAGGRFPSAGDVIRRVYYDDTKTMDEKTEILESISGGFSVLARMIFGGESEVIV